MENQSKPVFIFAKWQVKIGELKTVLELLPELIDESKKEEGNLFYRIYQDSTDPNTLILNESYKDMESIEFHKTSNHYKGIALNQIVPLLEKREVNLASQLDL